MSKRKKQLPKMAPAGQGRPAVQWDVLFDMWCVSKKPKRDFLLEYGLTLSSGRTREMTKHWTQDAKRVEQEAAKLRLEQRAKQEKDTPKTESGLWQFVQQMRKGQASEDWKTAQACRSHVKMILQDSVEAHPGLDPTSKLSPREILNLAEALEKIQRIQRLALGMSTDNVGVTDPGATDSNVEGVEDGSCPLFVVEVNDNGKFKRARPRQVR